MKIRSRYLFLATLFSVSCNFMVQLLNSPAEITPMPESSPIPDTSAPDIQTPPPQMEGHDGMILVYIPAGEFLMSIGDGEEVERPQYTQYVDAFWIDKTEITNDMYLQCVQAGACSPPLSDGFTGPKDFYTKAENAGLPVNFVSWNNATEYCDWAGRRLPSEEEWEKAARGTSDRLYPWGDDMPTESYANFGNNFEGLMPVGSFPEGASPYGVFDMLGNVWEYVVAGKDQAVLKGGGYFDQPPQLGISSRNETYPEYNRSADFGFRCASD